MLKMRDFFCNDCQSDFEALVRDGSTVTHADCGSSNVETRMSGGKTFTTIVATTKTSKQYKAGYIHSHGKRPKTDGKIQVGYTGTPSK
jgi:hypothetical protein